MPDKASLVGTLSQLKTDALTGVTTPAVGSTNGKESAASYLNTIQRGIAAGGLVGQFVGVDFSALSSAAKLAMQNIPSTIDLAGTPVEDATVDVAYTGFTVTASLGVAPYTFSVLSGTLPTGLTLTKNAATTAVVAGTPTEEEVCEDIVIRVTDNFGYTADLDPFTITVAAA